jgi:hypothetical protein
MYKAQIDSSRYVSSLQVKGFTKVAKTFNCLPH